LITENKTIKNSCTSFILLTIFIYEDIERIEMPEAPQVYGSAVI